MYAVSDGKKLVDLARKSIIDGLDRKQTVDEELRKKYNSKHGVFVTLNKHGDLRGCIGFVLPMHTIYDGIIHCARAAAFEDPRFSPVSHNELDDISIDISILTVPKQIEVMEKEELIDYIVIGRDGLIVRKGPYSGLLLPQVFVEYNSTPQSALEMTCQKAGLTPGAWKSKDCVVESFQAQVFKEEKPKGNVVEEKLS